MPRFRYLDALTTAFVVILLVSNLLAQKVVLLGPFGHVGGHAIGPFATSGAMVLFPIAYIFGDVFTEIYGEFANSYTMPKLKLITRGRWLWTRTVGSTVVGQAVDTTLVIVILFAGTFPFATLVKIIITGYLLKVAYEVIATPLTYLVIGWLKRAEGVDTFDAHTNFSPFRFAEVQKPRP